MPLSPLSTEVFNSRSNGSGTFSVIISAFAQFSEQFLRAPPRPRREMAPPVWSSPSPLIFHPEPVHFTEVVVLACPPYLLCRLLDYLNCPGMSCVRAAYCASALAPS
eukprot:4288717-Pyramimonas_sp.AAC.1